MEQIADTLEEKIKRLQLEAAQDASQAQQTGALREIGSECRCESYGKIQDIIRTCDIYETPFEPKTCNTIKKVWHKTLSIAGIFERFQDANFREINKRGVPEDVKSSYEKVKVYADNLSDNLKAGNGLVLKGPVGTLKTTLAIAVLQAALWQGFSGRKILMQSLLDEIFSRKAYNLEDWLKFERDLRECRLLVVDELGKHKSEGWVMTKFEAIVSERHERRRSTIFVTNLTAQEMRGLYSEGIIDRFNHVNEVVNFTGKSQRVKGD